MKKITGILAIVIAVVLLVGGFLVGFDRGVDVGGAHSLIVQINEQFEASDVEAIMKQAGATSCLVQKNQEYLDYTESYKSGEVAIISFEVEDNSQLQTVYETAEKLLSEKYFLKYPGTLSNLTSTLNRTKVVSMWPVVIIAIVMLAYVFVRFGAKMGASTIVNMFVTGAATLGIVGILGIQITGYTIPALLIACALAYGFAIVYALILKDNTVRMENSSDAVLVSAKQNKKLVLVISAMAVIAFALMLILGGVMLKNFAVTALIGIIINAAVAILVMPEMASSSKKA